MNPTDTGAYNRILALEKEGPPRKAFLKDYIEFLENYPGSVHGLKVINRLVKIKKDSNYPDSGSSYYTRWLAMLNKTGKLDLFMDSGYLKLDFPASTEIIKYLKKKKRYADALNIIDRNLDQATKEGDTERIYHHVREKYRLFEDSGELLKAAEFMIENSDKFSEKRNDRLKFFAALNLYKIGLTEKSMNILEKIVFNSSDSKYFLLALYKLGLIYMDQGHEIYAYSMWTNYLSDGEISPGKYFGGWRVFRSLKNINDFLSRTNNFCTFTFNSSLTCENDLVCLSRDTEGKYLSYYDLLYYHITGYDGFKVLSQKPNSSGKRIFQI
jgi:tetratricopeptide (TPR) repeat protein